MPDKADEIARVIARRIYGPAEAEQWIAAALRAYRDDAWQPIETAPKDGTSILGFWANGEMHTGSVWRSHARGLVEWCPEFDTEKEWDLPSHWQQLPNPPLKSKPESKP